VCVRVTTIVVESNKHYVFRVCVCVCSLSYPACKAHAPLYILSCGSATFFHVTTWFSWGGITEHQMCVQISFTTFVWNISHSTKNWVRYHTRMYMYMYKGLYVKYPLFLSELMNHEFSRQIFKKYSNNKFHENPSSGSRVVPCGRTDMNLIVAFRNYIMWTHPITFSVSYRPHQHLCSRTVSFVLCTHFSKLYHTDDTATGSSRTECWHFVVAG
jgi:hypothetical protein